MALATRRWSDREYEWEKQPDGSTFLSASIFYDVIDAKDEREAQAAVPWSEGAGHPVYPDLLFVSGMHPKQLGAFNFWRVEVRFSSDVPSGDLEGRFETTTIVPLLYTEEVDRDANHKAILNSAGFPPQNTQTNDFYDLLVTHTTYETQYDPGIALRTINKTNSDTFTLAGPPWLAPRPIKVGECLCINYAPTGTYPDNAPMVQVERQFVFREKITDDITGFDFRFMDVGNVGWVSNTATDQVADQFYYSGSSEPVSEPVRLDGSGKPIGGAVKVGKKLTVPRTNPNPVTWAKYDKRFSNDAVFICYPRKSTTAMRGLVSIFK